MVKMGKKFVIFGGKGDKHVMFNDIFILDPI